MKKQFDEFWDKSFFLYGNYRNGYNIDASSNSIKSLFCLQDRFFDLMNKVMFKKTEKLDKSIKD